MMAELPVPITHYALPDIDEKGDFPACNLLQNTSLDCPTKDNTQIYVSAESAPMKAKTMALEAELKTTKKQLGDLRIAYHNLTRKMERQRPKIREPIPEIEVVDPEYSLPIGYGCVADVDDTKSSSSKSTSSEESDVLPGYPPSRQPIVREPSSLIPQNVSRRVASLSRARVARPRRLATLHSDQLMEPRTRSSLILTY